MIEDGFIYWYDSKKWADEWFHRDCSYAWGNKAKVLERCIITTKGHKIVGKETIKVFTRKERYYEQVPG